MQIPSPGPERPTSPQGRGDGASVTSTGASELHGRAVPEEVPFSGYRCRISALPQLPGQRNPEKSSHNSKRQEAVSERGFPHAGILANTTVVPGELG
jgi:hypothetical protein